MDSPGSSVWLKSTVGVSSGRCRIVASNVKGDAGWSEFSPILSLSMTANLCVLKSAMSWLTIDVPCLAEVTSAYGGGMRDISRDWPGSTRRSNSRSTEAPIIKRPSKVLSRFPLVSSIPIEEALIVTESADLTHMGGQNGSLSLNSSSSAESIDESAVHCRFDESVLGTMLTVFVTGWPIDSKFSPRTFATIRSTSSNILSLTVLPSPVSSSKKFLIWSAGIPSSGPESPSRSTSCRPSCVLLTSCIATNISISISLALSMDS